MERNLVKRTDVLDSLVNVLASSVGSLTNPLKIYDTFKSKGEKDISLNTLTSYLSMLMSESSRYAVTENAFRPKSILYAIKEMTGVIFSRL